MKNQKIEKSEPPKHVPVTNANGEPIRRQAVEQAPTRIVYFVECAGMDSKQDSRLFATIRESYQNMNNDKYYLIPVRDRKVNTELIFGQVILDFVNDTCEIIDNEIKLKPGFSEVNVVREYLQ